MRYGITFLVVLAALGLLGCSDENTRKLNRVSKQIIDGAKDSKQSLADGVESVKKMEVPSAPSMPTKEGLAETGDVFIDKLSTATAEKVAAKLSEQVDSKVDDAQELYSDTQRSVRRTTDSARSTVRWVARKTPRSEREANQIVQYYGQEWMMDFQKYMDSVAKRGALRVDRKADQRRAEQKK